MPGVQEHAFAMKDLSDAFMDAAYQRLRDHGVETISPAPQTIPLSNPAAGGIRALYFRDPDRHALELIWFPTSKGNPHWQTPHAGVFLAIDHSALAIADTEKGQRFYESLNFHVAGRSLNFGPEQDALSGVPGARVRITSLAPEKGPAVEFLSYLSPGPGLSMPEHSAPNDLWHWEVTVAVSDLDSALSGIASAGGHRISKTPVDVSSLSLGYARAALVTDLDGHCLRLVQPARWLPFIPSIEVDGGLGGQRAVGDRNTEPESNNGRNLRQ
jgi:catechol 2,3-dioxygenase-like lactoylglutathione lyase family enzyme